MRAFTFFCTVYLYFSYVFGNEDSKIPGIVISCSDDEHCGDFRMVCHKENKVCICSRFYHWDEELQQCHLNLSELGLWLDGMKEETDLRGDIIEEANKVFSHLAFAGLFAIFCGLIGGLFCVYFFCFNKSMEEIIPDEGNLLSKEERKRNIESGDAGLSNILFIPTS